uniref:translation initiation factor IF-2-like n=1 Tax=Nyctereutes procyonoides TaxID=34880 RepID=UPI0024443C20|nr:translation initiation factor IF-2-like [Nyctereutes procyonoides]
MAGRRGRAAANAASAPGGRAAAARSAEIPASVPPPAPSSPEGTRPPRRPQAAGVPRHRAPRPHPLRPGGAALRTRSPADRRPPTGRPHLRPSAGAALSPAGEQQRVKPHPRTARPCTPEAPSAASRCRRTEPAVGRRHREARGPLCCCIVSDQKEVVQKRSSPPATANPRGRSPAELETGPGRGPRTPRKVLWLLTLPLGLEKRPPSGFLSLLHHCSENVRWPLPREVCADSSRLQIQGEHFLLVYSQATSLSTRTAEVGLRTRPAGPKQRETRKARRDSQPAGKAARDGR